MRSKLFPNRTKLRANIARQNTYIILQFRNALTLPACETIIAYHTTIKLHQFLPLRTELLFP